MVNNLIFLPLNFFPDQVVLQLCPIFLFYLIHWVTYFFFVALCYCLITFHKFISLPVDMQKPWGNGAAFVAKKSELRITKGWTVDEVTCLFLANISVWHCFQYWSIWQEGNISHCYSYEHFGFFTLYFYRHMPWWEV